MIGVWSKVKSKCTHSRIAPPKNLVCNHSEQDTTEAHNLARAAVACLRSRRRSSAQIVGSVKGISSLAR